MVKIGDWVHTVHNQNKITGFINRMDGNKAGIFVTIPNNYGEITEEMSNLVVGDSTIWLDDIPSLIDLSLKLNDKAWLQKWIEELSKWKSPNDIKWL